ncbi:MAG: hypothetical protein H6Q65_2641 [Firmicutes bacterium]|nr:hypothetical protein [Bacillota bacterium]
MSFKQEQTKEAASILAAAAYSVKAHGVRPEIVAAIVAAVCETMGTTKLAVRIRQTSPMWTVAGRQKLMDARQNILLKS